MKKISLVLAILLGGFVAAQAQYSTDPAQNLKISTKGSENIIRSTPSGNVYISTLVYEGGGSNISGAHIKLYKLDKYGKTAPGWDSNGIYVSKQHTATYSTGYGMVVLPDESVVIIHSDSRNDTAGNYFQPYVYKVSKDGDFEWGPNGSKAFTDDTKTQSQKPNVFLNNAGDVIATWNDIYRVTEDTLLVEKVNATFVRINRNGEPAYDPISAGNGLFITGTASGASDFILAYKNSADIPFTKRFDKDGNLIWASGQISNEPVFTGNAIHISSDGLDGAVIAYSGVSGSNHHAMLQRVDKDGNVTMGLNGIQVGKGYKDQNGIPVLAVDKAKKAIYVSYVDKAAGSMAQRVFTAKLDYEGNYLFGDTAFLVSGDPITAVVIPGMSVTDNGIIGLYAKDEAAGGYTSQVYAYGIDSTGNMLWGKNDSVLISSRVGSKGGFSLSDYNAGQVVLAWDIIVSPSQPASGAGLFVQNINSKGKLIAGIASVAINNIASFKTYPNPAHGNVNVEVSLTKPQNVSIDIFDTFGRKVANLAKDQMINGTKTFEWNAANMNKGVYFVTVYSGESKSVSKVIVQ